MCQCLLTGISRRFVLSFHVHHQFIGRGEVELACCSVDFCDSNADWLGEPDHGSGVASGQALGLFVELPDVRAQGFSANQAFDAIVRQMDRRAKGR